MTLHIQQYLRDGGTLEDLERDLGITAKRHRAYNNLVLLKYNQIESPMANPIVQECRGIILDESDNWKVIARAFDKFFNYGEGHAAQIDWSTARVQEKVDGSLCLLFYYNWEWHVATTGTPDAGGNVNNSGKQFSEYFWETFKKLTSLSTLPCSMLETSYCYILELTGPLNRVVVPHMESSLTLLGARTTTFWEEVHPSIVADSFPGIPVVKEFPLQSIEDVIQTFETMSPLSQEGYVIVDEQFRRIKVKHPGYVALHHAKDGMTTKAFVEITRTGEASETIAAFPEFKPLLDDAQERYNKLLAEIEADYLAHKDIKEQKDFALAVKNSRCSGALFNLRAGKVKSIREYLAKCHIDTMMRLLGY